MNCNTTHYRANSSSVPGDPTEIRGVQGAGVLKTLLDRKLVQVSGRKKVLGNPALYKTTKEFLVQFGLKDLGELPTLKEFEELSRLALGDEEAETEGETQDAETPEAAAEKLDSDPPNDPVETPREDPPTENPSIEEPPPDPEQQPGEPVEPPADPDDKPGERASEESIEAESAVEEPVEKES